MWFSVVSFAHSAWKLYETAILKTSWKRVDTKRGRVESMMIYDFNHLAPYFNVSYSPRCDGQVRASWTRTARWTTWATSPPCRRGREPRRGLWRLQLPATPTSQMETETWPARSPTSRTSPTWALTTPATSPTWEPVPPWTWGIFRRISYDAPLSCLMERSTKKMHKCWGFWQHDIAVQLVEKKELSLLVKEHQTLWTFAESP